MSAAPLSPVDAAIARWRERLPEELFDLPVFLLWVRKAKPGKQGKFDKIPLYANGVQRHGVNGSERDRAQLVELGDALLAFKRSHADGIGLALLPHVHVWALDLDDCVDDTGKFSSLAYRVAACGAYTEFSPSGRGVRALFAGKAGVDAKNHAAGVEVFDSRGFVTLTGDHGKGSLRSCPRELLAEILNIVRAGKMESPDGGFHSDAPPENAELLQGVKLPPHVWRRLVSPYPPGCDRSAAALSIALQLRRHGVTPEQALELCSIPEMLVPAFERRGGDIERARCWMWRYVVLPVYRRRAA